MTTDREWEKWGAQDPYFSVLTHPKYRAGALNDESRQEFFALGRLHVDHVMALCRAHLDGGFAPQRALDFGCGVGRVLVPLAAIVPEVVGVDIAPSMLAEARRNCELNGVSNAQFVMSDDTLSAVNGDFDLVHTCIVIQHIEIARGLKLFEALVSRIRPGGIGALQVTFAWDHYRANHGVRPPPAPLPPWHAWRASTRRLLGHWLPLRRAPTVVAAPGADPEMQMNFYDLSQLMFIVQQAGCGMVHTELTDHGGAIGAFMLFRRP